jgi:phage antirepressor YoqD-like protein
MNIITASNQAKTMSSSQLCDLLGYEKSEVNKKINSMFISEIAGEKISRTLRPNGQVDEYHLPEVETHMFVAKWDISHLRKVVNFFVSKPETPEQLLARAVISAQSVIEEKNLLLEQAKPAIELHESIVNDDGTLSMQEAGKGLQVKPNKFIEWLVESRYVDYKRIAYQSKLNAGYLVLSTTEHNGKPRTNTRVTGKGFAHFGKKLAGLRFKNPSHEIFYKS